MEMKASPTAPSVRPIPCDTLIYGATLLTVDRDDHVVEDGAIAISDGRIAAIGESRKLTTLYEPGDRVDARGGVVHPGFIDAHVHVVQYTSRSILSLLKRANLTQGDWKSALTEDDERASAAAAAADYLRSGYTGFVDHGTIFTPSAVADVADEIHIRLWLSDPYVGDLASALGDQQPDLVSNDFLALWPNNLEAAIDRLGRQLHRNANSDSLVKGYICLYGEETDSEDLFEAAMILSREKGVKVQKHFGFSPSTYLSRERRHSGSRIERLAERQLLDEHLTLVHMNVVHPHDVDVLASHKVGIVWCPYGQLRMMGQGNVESRMTCMNRMGIPVGLGSDIPRAGHLSGLGSLASVAASATGQSLPGADVLRMRTLGAAETIGAGRELGSLEVGKRADLVVRKPFASEHYGFDPSLEMGVIADSSSISAVFVDGRKVVHNGMLLTADQNAIVGRAQQSALRMAQELALLS